MNKLFKYDTQVIGEPTLQWCYAFT